MAVNIDINDMAFSLIEEAEKENDSFLRALAEATLPDTYSADGSALDSILNELETIDPDIANEMREKYYTDPETGITHIGKQREDETPWKAHLRLSGGKSKYFQDEAEYNEFRKTIE